jgi:DNA primase
VIGEYVRLKQAGVNWKGLCPFHHEKSPSFMVHREKQIWHCFGCGEGGDVFSFVQKIEHIDFPETLELLARKAQVELTRSGRPGDSNQRLRLFQLIELARNFFSEQLQKNPLAAKARDYLQQRGVTAESVATFQVGYSLPEWDKFIVLARSKGYSVEEVVAAGLALKSDRGPGAYDRFRDRLMFPIADAQGRTLGFGGRTLDPAAKEAKYINSPQSPVYNKSMVVYNLDRAKQAIKDAGYAVLVEGYMDVVGSWQAGVKNVVATSGTALTLDQLKLLKRYTNELRLAFDADLAGRSASERGIDLALGLEFEVKVIVLPFGKDPDECARQDAGAYRTAVEQALPLGDYAFQSVAKEVDFGTREGKKVAARRLLTAIAKLPDPVERDYYIKRLARELSVDERSLRERLASVASSPAVSPEAASGPAATPSPDRHQVLSHRLLALLLHYPTFLGELTPELLPEALAEGEPRNLYKHIVVYYNESHRVDFDELKAELNADQPLAHFLDKIFLGFDQTEADFSPDQAKGELISLVHQLKHRHLSLELQQLSGLITAAEAAGKADELAPLLQRFTEVSRALSHL